MKNVICLATGKTYDLILDTCVTAHPACAPYPKMIPEYLVPIKKGGCLEHLFRVIEIIECFPEDIYDYSSTLSNGNYDNLCRYHEIRNQTFGYGKSDTKYRFYILKYEEAIKPPCIKKGIQVSVSVELSDIKMACYKRTNP